MNNMDDYTEFPILDFMKLKSSSWKLYFTGGKILEDNLIKTIRPSVIKLDRRDQNPTDNQLQEFQIFYTTNGSIEVREKSEKQYCNQDSLLGSFVIVDCLLKFTIPDHLCEKYIRAFSNGFNEAYDVGSRVQDICENWCGAFDINFSDQFNTTCELGETDDGKLSCSKPYDIDGEYFTTTVVECENTIQ